MTARLSPLAPAWRRGGWRGGRRRGGRSTEYWTPAALGLRAWYDAELGQPKGVGYVQLDGTSGDYITTPDSASLSFSNDIEVVMRVYCNDWTAAANQTLCGKYVTTSNQRTFRFYVSTAGAVVLTASADGTAVVSNSITPSVALTDATWVWLRLRLDLTNGSNSVATLETAVDNGSNGTEPSSWTANGTQTGTALAGLYDSTAPLEIGTFQNGTSERFAGRVGRCIVRSGFAGTTVADFNADDCYGPGYLNKGALPTAGGSAYVPLRGVSGDYVWTAHKTLGLAADLDVVVRISDWDGIAANAELVSTRSGSSGEITFRKTNATQVGVLHFESGVAQQANITAATSATKWLRLTRDVDGGTGGAPLYTAYYSEQTTFDPNAVVWISGGSLTIGTAAGPTATTNPLAIGGPTAFAATGFHRVIVRSGIGGSVVADFNAAQATVFGQASDGYGNGWLIADPKHLGNWTLGLPKIYDRSGNGLAPATFGAGSNQPTWLPWKGISRVRSDGSIGNYVSAPTSPAYNISGDMEIVVRVTLDAYATSSTSGFLARFDGPSGSIRAYSFRWLVNVGPEFLWNDSGTSTVRSSPPGLPAWSFMVPGATYWLKVEFDADNGSGGCTTRYFVAFDKGIEPTSSEWILVSERPLATTASISSSTFPLVIGSDATALRSVAGGVHCAILRNGIGGPVLAQFDAASCGQSGYTDTLGNVWTVTRATSGRKAVVQSPVAASARSVILHGTDDYITLPLAAIPAMNVADNASVATVMREWATPTSFGIWWSTQLNTNASAGVYVANNGTAYVPYASQRDAGGNVASVGVLASAQPTGSRVVHTLRVAGRGAAASDIYINGVGPQSSAPDTSAVGDASASASAPRIGSTVADGNYVDAEFEAWASVGRVMATTEHGQLAAYYRGGL